MVVRVRAQELLPLPPLSSLNSLSNPNPNSSFSFSFSFSMRTSTLTLSNHRRQLSLPPPFLPRLSASSGTSADVTVEQRVGHGRGAEEEEEEELVPENEAFEFERSSAAGADLKKLWSAEVEVEVKELSELPEEWRRARLAWLCKELPPHKSTAVRILNGQRKWLRQEDATYVAVHCMRIRENETAFRVSFPSSLLLLLLLRNYNMVLKHKNVGRISPYSLHTLIFNY